MTPIRTPLVAYGGNPSDQGAGQQNTRKNNTLTHHNSQHQRMLAALKSGPVDTASAIYDMHIPHPACTIHRLRLQGHDIRTELRPAEFPEGQLRWAAEYSLLRGTEEVTGE